jgi:uncharacterized protein (DUF1684 family)
MSAPLDLAAWREDVARWREARLFRLQAPTGWLTLVYRLQLDEGDNPLDIGIVALRGGEVRFRAGPGVVVTRAGTAVSEFHWRADAEGTAPDRLDSGGRSYELMRRGSVLVVRVRDPQAPARRDFTGLDHFPLDPRWRVVARFERYDPPRATRHHYEIGEGEPRTVPGLAHFEVDGRALSLEPVIDGDGRRLYFVFGDASNGRGSYPGGRFLYAELPGVTSQLVLDFNLAFNPPCAFTPFAICPAVPPANRLPVAVAAGERFHDTGGADPA